MRKNNKTSTISSEKKELYVCSGSEVLKKITDENVGKVIYDRKNNKIYYTTYQENSSDMSDLNYVTIDGTKVSDGKLYATDVIMLSWPEIFLIGEAVIYYKNFNKDDCMGDLYLNNKKIGSNVEDWVWRIQNTDSFTYESNSDNDNGTCTLNLNKDGKVNKIADNILNNYYTYDENRTAYIINVDTNGQLFLYDDRSQTRQLIDTGIYDIIPPLGNQIILIIVQLLMNNSLL